MHSVPGRPLRAYLRPKFMPIFLPWRLLLSLWLVNVLRMPRGMPVLSYLASALLSWFYSYCSFAACCSCRAIIVPLVPARTTRALLEIFAQCTLQSTMLAPLGGTPLLVACPFRPLNFLCGSPF